MAITTIDPLAATEAAPFLPADPPLPLLRLLQLVSPTLPIGAFAYSQGLEAAVAAGWVRDEAGAAAWIGGLLEGSLAAVDLPLLARLHRAWAAGDAAALDAWSRFLHACRPAA